MTSILTLIFFLVAYIVSSFISEALKGRVFRSEYAAIYFSIGIAFGLVALLPLLGVEVWSFSTNEVSDARPAEHVAAGIFVFLVGAILSLLVEIRSRRNKK